MSAKQNPDDNITLNQLEGIQRSITNRLKQLQKKVPAEIWEKVMATMK